MPRKGDSHGRQPPWRHGAHPQPPPPPPFSPQAPLTLDPLPSRGARSPTAAPRAHQRPAADRTRQRKRQRKRKRRGEGRLRAVPLSLCLPPALKRPPEGGACAQRTWKEGMGNGGFKTLPVWQSLGK